MDRQGCKGMFLNDSTDSTLEGSVFQREGFPTGVNKDCKYDVCLHESAW